MLVAAVLLLAALGLLVSGMAQGSAALQWSSFAASALSAVILTVGELRRWRAGPDGGRAAPAERPAPVTVPPQRTAPAAARPLVTPTSPPAADPEPARPQLTQATWSSPDTA